MEVNGLWISELDELPTIPLMSMNSYLKHGHQFVLWSYQKSYKNLPRDCILKDAAQILPAAATYKDVVDSYAHFSDLWRWKFLHENGGFWTDLDVICLKDKIPVLETGIHICKMDDDVDTAMVGTLAFPKGHEVCKTMLEICQRPYLLTEFDSQKLAEMKKEVLQKYETHEDRLHFCPYQATYRVFGKIVQKFGLENAVLPHEYAYPIKYDELNKFTAPVFKLDDVVSEHTFAIHVWGSHFAKTMHVYKMVPCILKELYDRCLKTN